jgi:acetyltransferase
MEGVDNGAAFIEAARETSRIKPVVVLKSGGTAAGARAVSSHTGSLAGAESAYEAAFHQSGVIRAHSVEELFDYAIAFAFQPLPKGEALGIVTNAGGPGIMATDATERAGLRLAGLDKATVECLRSKLPAASNFYNPVDVLGDAEAERYGFAASCLLADPNVEAMVALLTPQAMTQPVESADAVAAAAAEQPDKPIFGCFMGGKMMSAGERRLDERRIPSYPVPERAVSAFAAMVGYKRWLDRPIGEPVSFAVDRNLARGVFAVAREDRRSDLGEVEARQILTAYGFKVPAGRLAHTADDALAAAAEIGYPVVLKIASPDILHKSDIGGVRVDLTSPEQVQDAFDLLTLRARRYMPDADIWGCLVQEMVKGGREVILGMSRDPQFGPLIMFGLGGIYVEVLKDVAFRLAPLTRDDAREMVTEIRSYPLLAGVRGQKAADTGAIVDGLLRVSQLVCDFPEIVEMDINPLSVMDTDQGAVAMDARVTVMPRENGK